MTVEEALEELVLFRDSRAMTERQRVALRAATKSFAREHGLPTPPEEPTTMTPEPKR